LIREGVPAAEKFTTWFTKEGVPGIKGFADEVKPLANRLLPAAADAFKAIKGFAKDALPFAEGIVDAFNDMPDWAKKALVGGVVAGGVAKKTGALSLGKGLGSGALGLVTKAKPLPVFVVNNVGGAGGVGGGGPEKFGKFGKMLPVIGAGGVVVGALVGSVYGTKVQSERFAADSQTPSGLNPGSRVLTGRGFGSDDPDKTARAYVNLGNQYDLSKEKLALFRDGVVKFNSTVDKTPREVELLFKSKGYAERMAEIQAIKDAIAAGFTATSDLTPRGFGSDTPSSAGLFAGANVNVTANTTAELAAEARKARRKAARAGHR
jgi:hypothetical protein